METLGLPHKRRHLQKENRGESVADDIMLEYREVMDGVLDFGFREIMVNEVAHAQRRPTKKHVQQLLDAHYAKFPEGFSLPSFLDNHDINRFMFEAEDRISLLKLAAEIQFRQRQPPILYYGTEAGMSQARDTWGPHGDLHARQPMPWPNPNPGLYDFYRTLIRKRKRSIPSLQRACPVRVCARD
jgi:glycosidase